MDCWMGFLWEFLLSKGRFDTWWENLILFRLQMQELLDLVSFFIYFKALNISQPSPNLWHYVVLNSLTKQLTKPNKPKTRHNLYIELWLLTLVNFITTKLGYKVGFKVLNFQRVEIGLLWDISLKIVLLRFIGKSELFILKGCYIDYLYQSIWLGFLLIKKST